MKSGVGASRGGRPLTRGVDTQRSAEPTEQNVDLYHSVAQASKEASQFCHLTLLLFSRQGLVHALQFLFPSEVNFNPARIAFSDDTNAGTQCETQLLLSRPRIGI